MAGEVVQMQRSAGLEAETAPLWRALADPTRRRILDLLTERPRITGEIASHFAISRIAVMRHLEVLGAAGLITSRKRGRERWHYFNAIPVQRLVERWTTPAAAAFGSRLLRLQDRVEARAEMERPAIDVALDVTIADTPKAVFAAITEDIAGWWGYPAVDARAVGLSLDPGLGGHFIEHWDEGGQVIATVTGWSPNSHVRLTGSFHLELAVGFATFDLEEVADGTLVRFSFRAIGVVDAQTAEGLGSGWNQLVGTRLKALVETGARMGVDGAGRTNVRAIQGQERESATPERPRGRAPEEALEEAPDR
jgi:DNA-binding transcriptional ArsR family regulator